MAERLVPDQGGMVGALTVSVRRLLQVVGRAGRGEPSVLSAVLAIEGSVVASGIVMGLICAAIGYWIGERKGRAVLGAVLGLILGIIGLLIILLIPAKHHTPTTGGYPPPAPG